MRPSRGIDPGSVKDRAIRSTSSRAELTALRTRNPAENVPFAAGARHRDWSMFPRGRHAVAHAHDAVGAPVQGADDPTLRIRGHHPVASPRRGCDLEIRFGPGQFLLEPLRRTPRCRWSGASTSASGTATTAAASRGMALYCFPPSIAADARADLLPRAPRAGGPGA